jgi:hypothetical protein
MDWSQMEGLMDGLESDVRFHECIGVRLKVSWIDWSQMEGFISGLESDGKFAG